MLTIPPQIRQEFLTDPSRSVEWQSLLQKFDQAYGSPAVAPAPAAAKAAQGPASSESAWEQIFKGAPKQIDALTGDLAHTFPLNDGSTARIYGGPQVFICASTSDFEMSDQVAIFTHGAGTWLVEEKAQRFVEDL